MAPPDSAEELLASVKLLMSETLVRQVGASYHFDINSEDGGHRRYYVDLSQGNWIIISVRATLNAMKAVFIKNQTCTWSQILFCVSFVGSGAAGAGSLSKEPDVTLSMSDRDLLAMFQGDLRPFAAYTSGRLKIQGDIRTAMKLEELINLLKK